MILHLVLIIAMLIAVVFICLFADWWILRKHVLNPRKASDRRRWYKRLGDVRNKSAAIAFYSSFCLSLALCLIILVRPKSQISDSTFMSFSWMICTMISLAFPRLVFAFIDMIGHIPFLNRVVTKTFYWLGVVMGALAFTAVWYGAFWGRYLIDVKPVDITIADLPESFDGYTIAQISDIHCGSWEGDTTMMSRIVDTINSLEPDLVVFTGDIVNRHSDEMKAIAPVIDRLRGRDGQIAILGNHDYGTYFGYDNKAEEDSDMLNLVEIYSSTSLNLLRNETRYIHRGNDSIAIIGVENVGHKPYVNRGSLTKAYGDASDATVKILLSHDPSHWEDSIAGRDDVNIALTLSGHTHAAQIALGRFSPAALLYRRWGGLYADDCGHQLYINIGVGTVGMPTRIGATPEISLFTLRKK